MIVIGGEPDARRRVSSVPKAEPPMKVGMVWPSLPNSILAMPALQSILRIQIFDRGFVVLYLFVRFSAFSFTTRSAFCSAQYLALIFQLKKENNYVLK